MSLKKRLTAVGMIAIAAAITFIVAGSGREVSEKKEDTIFTGEKETIYLWYTDEALTSYLSGAAVTYNETHDVRIVPILESGLEYLEKINQASLENSAPDLYIISHDSLEKACLAGLASEVKPRGDAMEDVYIGTGLKAASYKDKIVGYPFYFETSSLLYNKTYLRDMARSQLEAEIDQAEGEAAQERIEQNKEEESGSESEQEPLFTEEQVDAKVQELLPTTILDIETFADNYDAPQQ
ncbi:MAG: extracellular solute-binding protein, partial [Lachnospiraceae bacterium]|nr:extracellular solute-binding protein [Lachnospiraceae bacterium]